MKLNKTIRKYWYFIPVFLVLLGALIFVGYFLYLVLTPKTPPIIPNQSTIIEVQDGQYKKYTNKKFSYSFTYPAIYRLVENMPDFRDGYNRHAYLSRDNVYDHEDTKFISGVGISFFFYTDRTIDQEIESIKKGNNDQVSFTKSLFKGLDSIDLKSEQYPGIPKTFIPRPGGFLTIDFHYGPETSPELVKQYIEDFKVILESFTFLD